MASSSESVVAAPARVGERATLVGAPTADGSFGRSTEQETTGAKTDVGTAADQDEPVWLGGPVGATTDREASADG